MGEIGVVVVAPRDGVAPPSLADLRAFLDGRVAPYKWPEAIRIVAALPLTPMQKVDRRALAHAEVAEVAEP
jgi:acyl-CoA synthetase (AMP-forming)/AMP-acid ligase II